MIIFIFFIDKSTANSAAEGTTKRNRETTLRPPSRTGDDSTTIDDDESLAAQGREGDVTLSSVSSKRRDNVTLSSVSSRRRENATPLSVANRRREETTPPIQELPPIPALLESSSQRIELRNCFPQVCEFNKLLKVQCQEIFFILFHLSVPTYLLTVATAMQHLYDFRIY